MPDTDTRTPPGQLDDLTMFLDVRERLLGIARRIVGGTPDAEDVVQETWLRWNGTDRSVVRNAPAFLCRATARLSITAVGTAHARRQHSVGLWPVECPDLGEGPAALAERAAQLQEATWLLVGRLTAREQAAYVLREAFDYPYRQIGDALGLTEANGRQLVRRARVHVGGDSERPASAGEQLRLLGAFLQVSRSGDPAALAELAHDPLSMTVEPRAAGVRRDGDS
jgi:RNA polymerase sigma-70 factor (ECF subfamily)